MATHKVPQDVEAEDKLIGFLSLKQFIFVILGVGFSWLTFFFATKIHPLVAIIWIPPAGFFLLLGLYQRKDQPTEVFLLSALRFYLKPHVRKWDQEGYEDRVIITAPPKIEKHYTKDFSREEAVSRLGTLSHLMDSRGWTTKLAGDWQNPQLATAAASDRLVQPGQLRSPGVDLQQYMQPPDVMDESSSLVAQDFASRLTQTDSDARQHALDVVQAARQNTSKTQQASDTSTTQPAQQVPQAQATQTTHSSVTSAQNDSDDTATEIRLH